MSDIREGVRLPAMLAPARRCCLLSQALLFQEGPHNSGSFERQKTGANLVFISCPVFPIGPANIPGWAQALFRSDGVLDDHRLYTLRVHHGEAKSDRPTIVVEIENVVMQAELVGKLVDEL